LKEPKKKRLPTAVSPISTKKKKIIIRGGACYVLEFALEFVWLVMVSFFFFSLSLSPQILPPSSPPPLMLKKAAILLPALLNINGEGGGDLSVL